MYAQIAAIWKLQRELVLILMEKGGLGCDLHNFCVSRMMLCVMLRTGSREQVQSDVTGEGDYL